MYKRKIFAQLCCTLFCLTVQLKGLRAHADDAVLSMRVTTDHEDVPRSQLRAELASALAVSAEARR